MACYLFVIVFHKFELEQMGGRRIISKAVLCLRYVSYYLIVVSCNRKSSRMMSGTGFYGFLRE